MSYDDKQLARYKVMVRERHRIWEKRQYGVRAPWTEDPVLSKLKMTNMFRVLDPGSQFVFDLNSRDPLDVIARLVAYRITNLPDTWRSLSEGLGHYPTASDFVNHPGAIVNILQDRQEDGLRVFSGAYIIVPEPGTANDKVEGVVTVTRRFIMNHGGAFLSATTEDERFKALLSTPGLGVFLSMQILTDWGYLQKTEPDLSFVMAGPGARRGAAILNPDITPEDVIYDLATMWSDDNLVQLEGRRLTPMDVQNTLCEWSKYARESVTLRRKNPYVPAHPGRQPKPVVPHWW